MFRRGNAPGIQAQEQEISGLGYLSLRLSGSILADRVVASTLRGVTSICGAQHALRRGRTPLRVTSAMEARITDHVWSLGDLLEGALTAPEPPPLPLVGRSVRPSAVRVLPGQLALPGVL